LGAGSDPRIGEEATRESLSSIRGLLQGADLVFLTGGLGGGTGTGSLPLLAEAARREGALTVAVVTLPLRMEGEPRLQRAIGGLDRLEGKVDTLVVLPNDRLRTAASDIPLREAFRLSDRILTLAVRGLVDTIVRPGLVNLDFADLQAVVRTRGLAVIAVGESDSRNRATDAVQSALRNPLVDMNVSGARALFVNVCGGEDLSLEECGQVVDAVSPLLQKRARVIWGAQIDNGLGPLLRVTLLVSGVPRSRILG
jgi:cell division protein FtsZ